MAFTVWKKCRIFGKIFGIFQICAKNDDFWHISIHNFWTTIGIMLPPLLSSQMIHFERLRTQFGRNFEFLAKFLKYFKFELKIAIFSIFQPITLGLPLGSCYLLFYHLKLSTLEDWTHISEEIWKFWQNFRNISHFS